MVMDEERRNTPKGYRHEPHNKVDRHKAADAAAREEAQEPSYEPYTKPPTGSAIGQPPHSEGTMSSLSDDAIRDRAAEPDVIDTVVEGRLGGGEETIYSPIDGPPLHHSDPKPRS